MKLPDHLGNSGIMLYSEQRGQKGMWSFCFDSYRVAGCCWEWGLFCQKARTIKKLVRSSLYMSQIHFVQQNLAFSSKRVDAAWSCYVRSSLKKYSGASPSFPAWKHHAIEGDQTYGKNRPWPNWRKIKIKTHCLPLKLSLSLWGSHPKVNFRIKISSKAPTPMTIYTKSIWCTRRKWIASVWKRFPSLHRRVDYITVALCMQAALLAPLT